jgi:thiol-disulfide isomerase/thioredoxin
MGKSAVAARRSDVRTPPPEHRKEPKGAGAKRRAAARRRAQRRKILSFAIPAGVIAVIAVVAVVLSLGGSSGPAAKPAGTVTVAGPARPAIIPNGGTIPNFSAPGLTGGRVSWSDYRGSPTVLALWAPWCPHCQKELPILSGAVARYPGVKLVTIATEVNEKPGPTVDEYVSSRGLTFPVAMDDRAATLAKAFGLQGFPTVYYVNPDGTVNRSVVGEAPESDMEAAIRAISGR